MKWNERDEQASLEAYRNGTLEPLHPQHKQQLLITGSAVPLDAPEISREQLMKDYMDASAELHEAGVEHMTSLTDVEFCNWVIDVVNGDGRDSMKFAVLREGAIERLEGLGGLD